MAFFGGVVVSNPGPSSCFLIQKELPNSPPSTNHLAVPLASHPPGCMAHLVEKWDIHLEAKCRELLPGLFYKDVCV